MQVSASKSDTSPSCLTLKPQNKIIPLKKALITTRHFTLNTKKPQPGLFQYVKLSLFTQIHFLPKIQLIKLIVL